MESINLDIEDADHFESAASLLSMGKLAKKGWKFEIEQDHQWAYLPDGQRITLKFENDVLILPHDLREGEASKPLPYTLPR